MGGVPASYVVQKYIAGVSSVERICVAILGEIAIQQFALAIIVGRPQIPVSFVDRLGPRL